MAQWRAGELRPLCIFGDARADYKEPIADGKAWADIPTCKESGLDIEYNMLRGIFTTPGATPEQVAFYVDLMEKVRGTDDWQAFMDKGAFKNELMTGDAFTAWLTAAAEQHHELMAKAGFLSN